MGFGKQADLEPEDWLMLTDHERNRMYAFNSKPFREGLRSERFESVLKSQPETEDRLLDVDPARTLVEPIPKVLAKRVIIQNHYSHALKHAPWPLGFLTFATPLHKQLWTGEPRPPATTESKEQHQREIDFINSWLSPDDDYYDYATIPHLLGVLVFSHPVAVSAWKSISSLIAEPTQVVELTRLFIADRWPYTGRNAESWFVGQGLKWLQQNKPEVKAVVSYADPYEGHAGYVYRATNFICTQPKDAENREWTFSRDGGKTWSHFRRAAERYGRTLEDFKRTVPRPFLARRHNKKIKYIKFLTGKSETKRLLDTMYSVRIPYSAIPKTFQKEIVEVK